MVAWSQLGRCTANATDCSLKGSCRKFCPLNSLDGASERDVLLASCLCGCRGMQHEVIQQTAQTTSSTASGTTRSSGDNNPGPAGPSGPGLGANFTSVGDGARARKAKMNEGLMDDIKANVYDPVSKIHQNSWAKLSSRPDNKRKNPPTTSSEPAAKRKVPASATKVDVDVTLVLAEDTAAVDRGEYEMPTATKMRELHRLGYIQYTSLPPDTSPADVARILRETYADIPAVAAATVEKGLRLLCIISVKQGATALLQPHALNKITVKDLQMASATHRQAKDFKKCVYLALPRAAKNLPFGNTPSAPSDSDVDMDSDETDDFPASPMKPSASASSSPEKPSQPTQRGPTPGPSAGPSAGPREPKYEVPVDSPINDAFRLIANMSRPSSNKAWWPIVTTEPYCGALEATPMIQRQLHRAQSNVAVALSLDAILSLLEHDLFPEISFVLDFGDSALHQKNFRLGSHGLEPIVDVLFRFRRFLTAPDMFLPAAHLRGYVERVDTYGAAIYSGLLTFRGSVNRELYDPPAFAAVHKILRTRGQIFPAADPGERFSVLELSVFRDDPALFEIRLNSDFQINEVGQISSNDCLLVGEHGIDGFMVLVGHVLDLLPLTHGSYEALYNLFKGTCESLLPRLTNYTKSHGKKKQGDRDAPPKNTDGGRPPDSKDEGRPYDTRHSRSRSQPADGDDDDYCAPSDTEDIHEFEPSEQERKYFTRSSSTKSGSDGTEPGRRPKTPYSSHIPKREEFARPPSPPPRPRPRPRPTYRGPPTNLTPLEKLARITNTADLLEAAVKEFPHPDQARRKTWNDFEGFTNVRKCWHQVSLLFHPDRNSDTRDSTDPKHQAWQKDCTEITKLLNSRLS
ncbi:hypothetical protein DFH06DRAFT_1344834 [Mycena polygramma]|nr:hypothetical protein DFH06DRAFT_1344834 [Mycena polygramma]